MLKELLSILTGGDNPMAEISRDFHEMLSTTREMTVVAGQIFLDGDHAPEDRTKLYERDIEVNRRERRIRKGIVAHLSANPGGADVPHCLVLVGLVKDVERLGDYAKNMSEIREIHPATLPDDELTRQMRRIREDAEAIFASAAQVFESGDKDEAVELIRRGRDAMRACEELFTSIARSDHSATTATALVLGSRYYKRIVSHLVNILSSVVMPVHMVDYYDEKELPMSLEEALEPDDEEADDT